MSPGTPIIRQLGNAARRLSRGHSHLWLVAAAGGLVFLLGLAFLGGWALRAPALISGQPGVDTIPPSGALGFLLCGAGLAAAALWGGRPVLLCGGGAALLGGTNLVGHLLGAGPYVDGLLFRLLQVHSQIQPGGMPPGGAIAFLVAGAGIVSAAAPLAVPWRTLVLGTEGAVVVVTGILSRTGYIGQAGATWDIGLVPGMPGLAAFSFLLLGGGLVGLGFAGKDALPSQGQPRASEPPHSLVRATPANPVLLILGTGFLLGSISVFLVGLQQAEQADAAVRHTLNVVNALGRIEKAAVDMQSGERGYVITGQASFLAPYELGSKDFAEAHDLAKRLTADNPEQQQRLEKARSLREQWGAYATSVIALRQGPAGASRTQALVARGGGKALVDGLRAELELMTKVEIGLLAERRSGEAATRTVLTVALLFCVVGGILAGMTQFLLARRLESQRRMLVSETASRAAAELRFRQFVERAPHAMVIVNPEGKVLLVNSQVLSWFGYAREELIGQPIEVLIPERFRLRHPEYLSGFVRSPTARPMGTGRDLYGLRKDGTEFPVDISLGPVETAEGLQVIASIADITERRRIEENLRQANLAYEAANQELEAVRLKLEAEVEERTRAKERFRTILDQAPQPIIVSDADGRMLEVNSATTAEFGYGRAEMIGQPGSILIPARDHVARAERRDEILAELKERSLGPDLVCVRKDGSEFPAVGRVCPMQASDGLQFITSLVNISERKQIEESLKRTNSAYEAVNKELEAFAYSVSHDLRAPIRGMAGFSQILIEDFGPQLPQEAQKHLRVIQSEGQRMGQLIDDMLNLSRVTRTALRREPVNLSALAAEVLAALRKAEPERKADCIVAEGLTVSGDPRLLKIMLDNLLGNAWKFTGHTAKARIEFGTASGDGGPAFFVRDNGAGFDMAYADKLFGAFQRLHTSNEFPGTGIGLAIVHRIVSRHGGRIWAEGAKGQGATFHFSL